MHHVIQLNAVVQRRHFQKKRNMFFLLDGVNIVMAIVCGTIIFFFQFDCNNKTGERH